MFFMQFTIKFVCLFLPVLQLYALHVSFVNRKKEEDMRRRLLENPIKMKQLQKTVCGLYSLFLFHVASF